MIKIGMVDKILEVVENPLLLQIETDLSTMVYRRVDREVMKVNMLDVLSHTLWRIVHSLDSNSNKVVSRYLLPALVRSATSYSVLELLFFPSFLLVLTKMIDLIDKNKEVRKALVDFHLQFKPKEVVVGASRVDFHFAISFFLHRIVEDDLNVKIQPEENS